MSSPLPALGSGRLGTRPCQQERDEQDRLRQTLTCNSRPRRAGLPSAASSWPATSGANFGPRVSLMEESIQRALALTRQVLEGVMCSGSDAISHRGLQDRSAQSTDRTHERTSAPSAPGLITRSVHPTRSARRESLLRHSPRSTGNCQDGF